MKTALPSNWHTMIDARNRELHQIIAGKIRQNPALIRQVKETLERWFREMDESERGHGSLVEWQHWLGKQPLSQVLDFLASEDEEACRLRQSTPFVGLLTEQERSAVF